LKPNHNNYLEIITLSFVLCRTPALLSKRLSCAYGCRSIKFIIKTKQNQLLSQLFIFIFYSCFILNKAHSVTIPERIFQVSEQYDIVGLGEGNAHNVRNSFEILKDTLKLFINKYDKTYIFLKELKEVQPLICIYKAGDLCLIVRNSFNKAI